ncbi:MAG: AIR synthase family protein [Candidatus Thorarchaeota archaeon]
MIPGKVPPDILREIVFKKLGTADPDVVLGPELGEDASLVKVGDSVLIAATDPITGSVEDVGWLAVHANANDIATFGVRPRWFLASIILPSQSTADDLNQIVSQIDQAAKSLSIAVVGGHSEVTDGIDRPIVVGFMLGVTEEGKYVTSGGVSPGDVLVMTKTAAIEGTSILASEGREKLAHLLGSDTVRDAIELRQHVSVVAEGVAAFETGHVTAMHDPTEGGLANGILEMCDASGVGCVLDIQSIPIHEATKRICETLVIDPLALISSGSMLIACRGDSYEEVTSAVRSLGIEATVIGKFVPSQEFRKTSDGVEIQRPSTDALWSALQKLERM